MHARRPTNVVVLDMDNSVSPTHGEQEGAAYNGHFGCTCYHPLFVFNQFAIWSEPTCAPATSTAPMAGARCWNPWWRVIARARSSGDSSGGDAAFTLPDLYDFLEAEGYNYAIRLKANMRRRREERLQQRALGISRIAW